ncbi:MAG: SpoIIIAH-like family protein [Ruminococcaceae bacterium]|nr:SpoIIIAH-like family protein [Oscillospiraceae bacterium]
MKIIKTTEKQTCRALVGLKNEGSKESRGVMEKITDFFGEHKKRAIIIACSVLMIGSAVLLNLKLFGETPKDNEPPKTTAPEGTSENVGGIPETELDDTYFALAVIERQRARDEAIEVLQSVVDSSDAAKEDKDQALETISKIAEDIRCEANIETLLKAAGYEDCIAIIENGKANIVVSTSETLMADEIARITEIVYTQAAILPTDLVIKER